MALIAQKRHRYGGRAYNPGDVVIPRTPRDARVLTAARLAREEPDEAASEPTMPRRTPGLVTALSEPLQSPAARAARIIEPETPEQPRRRRAAAPPKAED